MADNVVLKNDASTTVGTLAADDIGSVLYPRSKITLGADGTNDGDVSSANPLPVTGTITAVTNLATIGTSVTPGTSAAHLGKAEDAAHASGDTGVMALAVRQDTASALATTDGDYIPLIVDSTGKLHVNVGNTVTVGSHAVTNAGTFAVQASLSAAIPAGTNNIGDVDVLSIAAGDNNIGNVDIVTVPTDPFGANADAGSATGSISAKLRFIASTGIPITGTVTVGSHAVTNAGTFAVQESGGVLTALQIMDDWDNAASDGASVSGDVAHDAADAGEPVKNGFKATTALSGLTLVANADRTDGFAGIDGVQIVRSHCNLEDIVQERTTNTDGASTAFASGLAAPGANIRLYITTVVIANSSASFCTVDLRDGAAGSVLWTLPVPATGGVVMKFDPPLKLTANTALAFDASAATSTLSISASGFKSKV